MNAKYILLIATLLVVSGCKNKSVVASEELAEITSRRFQPGSDIQKLKEYSKHADPWVRANCAGAIKFIAVDCDQEHADTLIQILSSLSTDTDPDVKRVANNALLWVKDVRKKK